MVCWRYFLKCCVGSEGDKRCKWRENEVALEYWIGLEETKTKGKIRMLIFLFV